MTVTNIIIDMTSPGYYREDIIEAIETCETKNNCSATVVVNHDCDAKSVLDYIYEIVKNSQYTVTEPVSYKQNRISFITGSYLQIETKEKETDD